MKPISAVTSTLPNQSQLRSSVQLAPHGAASAPTEVGRFQVLRLLGWGGQGSVYLGHDPQLDRLVAIKRLHLIGDQSREGRVAREAQILALLNHANVVSAYELVRDEQADYVITEYVEGTTLRDVQQQPMALSHKLDLAMQIAQGLRHAHSRNVLHRDLKPSNILIDKDGRAKITDFGIAMVHDESGSCEDAGEATQWLRLSGTPCAMAPEHTLGLPTDHRSDIFSLGLLYYQLFTGAPAFTGAGDMDLEARVRGSAHTPAIELDASLPPKLSRLFDRMLEKQPSARPAHMDVVIDVLDRVIEEHVRAETVRDVSRHDVAHPLAAIIECKCDPPAFESEPAGMDLPSALELDLDGIAASLAQRFEVSIVASYAGRVVACVGVPQVHEHVARAALHFAGELQRCIADRERTGGRSAIGVRLGIALGRVQVRDGHRKRAWGGRVFERAASLCAAAQVGHTLIDAGMLDELQSTLGAEALRGITEPAQCDGLAAFALSSAQADLVADAGLRPASAARALPGSRMQGLREAEQALFGQGGSGRVQLFGPGGVGKTHLVRALLRGCPSAGLRWVIAEGDPSRRFQAFGGVAGLLEQLMELPGAASSAHREARIGAFLSQLGISGSEVLPKLLVLLSPQGLAARAPSSDEGARTYRRMLQSATQVLAAVAEQQPLLVVLEGAQWLDHSSQEVIARVCARVPGDRFRVLVTSRAATRALDVNLQRVEVAPLEEAEAQDFLDGLSDRPLSAHERQQIVDVAEGIPLLLKLLAEQCKRGLASGVFSAFPGLEGTIAVRLEEFGEVRRVAEYAAVLGREFNEGVLSSILNMSARATQDALRALEHAQLIVRRDIERGQWVFAHGKVLEAVYQAIAPGRRVQMHAMVVEIASRDEGGKGAWPAAALARHCRHARQFAQAASKYRAAAIATMAAGAYFEARCLLEAALADLSELRQDAERIAQERELRIWYSQCLVASEGWCSDTKQDNTRRLEALHRSLGAELSPAHAMASFMAAMFSGDLAAARGVIDLFDPHPQDDELAFLGHTVRGYLDFFTGQWDRALASYDAAISIRESRLGDVGGRRQIADCGLELLCLPDQQATLIKLARQQDEEALVYRLRSPGANPSGPAGVVELTYLGYGVTQALLVSHLPGGLNRLHRAASALHTMASAQKNALYSTFAQLGSGYAQVMGGSSEGLKWMQRAHQSMDAMGMRGALRLYYDCFYVQALLQVGQADPARALLDQLAEVARSELATFCRPSFLILAARTRGMASDPGAREAVMARLDEALAATQALAVRGAARLQGHIAFNQIQQACLELSASRGELAS